MRKIIQLMHVSLDGYVAGPNGEMDWIVYDDEVQQRAHDLHARTDAAIYGRVTFQMMEGYWPSVLAEPSAHAPAEGNHARWYADATKLVLSRTLKSAASPNTVFIANDAGEAIRQFKSQPGKDIWLLGSASVVQELAALDLIDEYRLNVNPVVLGRGKPLFGATNAMKTLKLVRAQTFKCGVVELRYEPASASPG